MNTIKDNSLSDGTDTIPGVRQLLKDMTAELKLRGCEDTHALLRRARDLDIPLKNLAGQLAAASLKSDDGDAQSGGAIRLHQMPAHTVAETDLARFTREDLVEAAFGFENALMELLGDDNTMPMEIYQHLAPVQLEDIIQSAVEKICRINGSR